MFRLLMILIVCRISFILCIISASENMPPLYHFDDYDACLQQYMDNNTNNVSDNTHFQSIETYCVVYAEIVPNASSALWHRIETFSNEQRKRYFRHDRLYFGVCLQSCMRLLSPLDAVSRKHLYAGKVQDTEIIDYYENVYNRFSYEQMQYDRKIDICLNLQFRHAYQLSLRTKLEYCERRDFREEHDELDYTAYGIFCSIITLNIFSTVIDYYLRKKTSSNNEKYHDFYKKPLNNKAQSLLTSFSVCRNYFRLTAAPKSKLNKNLNFLGMYRASGVSLVIFAHALILCMSTPMQNPDFFEDLLQRTEAKIIENSGSIIQIFFVISGFLLYINFSERKLVTTTSTVRECVNVYGKAFLYRYLRLIPSLIMLILFNATLLVRLQNGPFWQHLTEGERSLCRDYWWKNVFFINNSLLKHSCAQQTWYLAADMQLFCIYLFILIIIAKCPKLAKLIIGILLVLSFAIPSIITYSLNLAPIFHLNPESYRYMFFKDAHTFYQSFIPSYTNLGGYLLGILCAHWYIKSDVTQQPELYRGKWKYEIAWCSIIPMGFILIFTGAYAMTLYTGRPSIWLALFAGVYSNLWAMLCAGSVLGMCCKLGSTFYEISTSSIFRILGRISYQAFLWHIVVLRLLIGYHRQPVYMNRLQVFFIMANAFALTNVISFLMVIVVEYPIDSMLKILLKPHSKNTDNAFTVRSDNYNLNETNNLRT